MRVLAVDTTGNAGSLAILDGEQLLEEPMLPAEEGFSTMVFERAMSLFARCGWSATSIDCFAAAAGPGSFTGVRTGLAFIKGLAEGAGRAAIAVSNLQALAECGSAGLRAAVCDARRGELYAAVYDDRGTAVLPETVVLAAGWFASLPLEVDEVITAEISLMPSLPARIRVVHQPLLAGAIARIAIARLRAGDPGDPAAIDANYVRRSDANMNWKDEPVARTPRS